jgi:hypothetical protein
MSVPWRVIYLTVQLFAWGVVKRALRATNAKGTRLNSFTPEQFSAKRSCERAQA